MYNILLDGLPTEYKGHKIRTSYKVGIMISLLLDDEDVDPEYKIFQAVELLYVERPADLNEAFEGVTWFLSCGSSEVYYVNKRSSKTSQYKPLDFQFDAMEIFGTFKAFGISLTDETHWFEFMSIIHSLPQCPLTEKIGYRSMDITKFKGQQRAMYYDLQERIKVCKAYTKEEYEAIMKDANRNYGSFYEQMMRLNS